MDCPIFNVINGKTLGMNTQKGSSVQVKCNVGFKLNNKDYQFRTCLSNGHWSGTGGNSAKVECLSKFSLFKWSVELHDNSSFNRPYNITFSTSCSEIRCGAPPTSGNVQVKLTGGDSYQGIASYSCLAGQCLNGDSTRRCQSNARWSGIQPSCLRKQIYPLCIRVVNENYIYTMPAIDWLCFCIFSGNSCCRPPMTAHSTFYSDNRYNANDAVFIRCDKGYTLTGDDYRECQSNLRWSGVQPKCTSKSLVIPNLVMV